ncbi:endonuclease domain-containing protein [Hydrogenophaga sp.]|uniref:endonuclease domain-containing protein n=1 Tax=Hydrogenophaga sp. TaxID=1904254 RepID=UPI003D282A27
MQNQATPNARLHARALRRDMTDAERKLWSGLRGEQLGFKLRRQHPLGNFIADFACLEPKLIVESGWLAARGPTGLRQRKGCFLQGAGL